MKKRIFLLLIAILPILGACSSKSVETPVIENSYDEEGQLLFLTIPAPSLKDNLIEESDEQEIGVYLPYGYEVSDKRYPVLYFLTGFEGDYKVGAEYLYNAMNGQVNDMIAVSVKGQNRFGGGFYANSPVCGNWQDYITFDLVDYIDSTFRTIPKSSARGLVGHSMGGLGVINIVSNTTGVFDYAYAMSPAIATDDGFEYFFDFRHASEFAERFTNMDNETARALYLDGNTAAGDFYIAYATAFGYNTQAGVPYYDVPGKENNGKFLRDETWMRYFGGMSNLSEKIENGKDNLSALKKFTIEYGEYDQLSYIPYGCQYFDQLLTENNISHEIISFDGDHASMLEQRLKDVIVPFFSEAFK